MIFYYKHKEENQNIPPVIQLSDMESLNEFANLHGIDPFELFMQIRSLEFDIQSIKDAQFDFSAGENFELFNKWINCYIDYFNSNAIYDKQAYVLIGNIASGKNTYANLIKDKTGSIIVDADYFKMSADTNSGFFEGFTSLYKEPTDREKMQNMCGEAGKRVMKNVADLGMNLILPKAPSSYVKLEQQLQYLFDKNYDVHLILFDVPTEECIRRSYLRYLIKEYDYETFSNGIKKHGRFVPKKVITSIGDKPYHIFAKAYKSSDKFATFKAFHNDKNKQNEEIDLETMIF